MARVYIVRHGKAATPWGDTADPGLDSIGHSQAERVATRLRLFGPLPLIASPLRRTRETAGAFGRLWQQSSVRIEPRVGEIPAPICKEPGGRRGSKGSSNVPGQSLISRGSAGGKTS